MESLKDNIIFNIFEYLETGDLMFANKAKEYLNELAGKYHISLRKSNQKADLKVMFKKFILNKEGYSQILPMLYNSI
ncbi:MAG: hypothetical protein WC720_05075 [Candidatus Shapirobacteria bacterium]|jgi:ABC-type polysaccharide/polyol phosphate transport system ATPase subunit